MAGIFQASAKQGTSIVTEEYTFVLNFLFLFFALTVNLI